MANEPEPVAPTPEVLVDKRRAYAFKPGHPKYGGRKKGSANKRTKMAQEMAAQMGVDPVRFMLELLQRDTVQVAKIDRDTGKVILDENGQPVREWQAIPIDMRLEAAKSVAPYIHGKLQHTTVTKEEPESDINAIDVNRMMEDPALVEAAQRLALAANDAPALPAPERDQEAEFDAEGSDSE